MVDIPITPEMIATLVGAAFVAGLLTQWLKKYLGDNRYTGVLVLVLSIALQLGVTAVSSEGPPDWVRAAILGFLGASIATFGYETLTNLAGVLGVGSRAQ